MFFHLQWDDSQPNAGFTTGKPWMKLNPDDAGWSVAQQEHASQSVLNFWRKLLMLRQENIGLVSITLPFLRHRHFIIYRVSHQIYGKFVLQDSEHDNIFIYTVEHATRDFLVLMNWSDKPVADYNLPSVARRRELLLSNYPEQSGVAEEGEVVKIRGWEASLYILL